MYKQNCGLQSKISGSQEKVLKGGKGGFLSPLFFMYKFIGFFHIFGIKFSVYNKGDSYLYINKERKIFERIDLY